MTRLSLQVGYLWRRVSSTAPPFILWWWNLEILFGPLHRSSPFIGDLRCQAIQMEHGPYIAETTQNAVFIVRCLCCIVVYKWERGGGQVKHACWRSIEHPYLLETPILSFIKWFNTVCVAAIIFFLSQCFPSKGFNPKETRICDVTKSTWKLRWAWSAVRRSVDPCRLAPLWAERCFAWK
jgi:hypothetical protein